MKVITSTMAAILIALFTLAIPAPIFTTEASASKMNGKGSQCSTGANCMQDRYYAAKRKEAKTKKPTQ
jgi:hypothetical protein